MGCKNLRAVSCTVEPDLEDPGLGQQDEIVACETEVGHSSLDMDLADQIPRRRPDVQPVSAAAVNITIAVELQPVWDTRIADGKHASVGEESAATPIQDVEGVNCMWLRRVWILHAEVKP